MPARADLPSIPKTVGWSKTTGFFWTQKKVWKIEAELAPVAAPVGTRSGRDIDALAAAAAIDPGSLHAIRIPRRPAQPVLTNFDGLTLRIALVASGTRFVQSASISVAEFAVEILEEHPSRRIINLSVGEPLGLDANLPYISGLLGSGFVGGLKHGGQPVYFSVPDPGVGDLEFSFALVKNYPVEFLVQPKIVNQTPAPSEKIPPKP